MRIVSLLTYYHPHVSGLTIYAQRLMEGLASRGHQAVVVTSRFSRELPLQETLNGVEIVRVPVMFRVSKGAIMPGYWARASEVLRSAQVMVVHLPNTPLESAAASFAARVFRTPLVMTYHCDVQLPGGFGHRVIDTGVFLSNWWTAARADRVVAYTDDYARNSSLLSRFPHKRLIIPPPVPVPHAERGRVEAFRSKYAPDGAHLIGFAARLATEKGVEYAVEALEKLARDPRCNKTRVLFAGEHLQVVGEDTYRAIIRPLIERLGDRWVFLGVLNPGEMGAFYSACDVTILPSINRTESFGLVQVESMLCGTPVVASNLPGVRVPIELTGMGRLVPPKDSSALADAIVEVLQNRDQYVKPRSFVEGLFSVSRTVSDYEQLFSDLTRTAPRLRSQTAGSMRC